MRRQTLAALIVLSALSTAASCPPKPTEPQRQEQVVLLAQSAKRAEQIVHVVESAQTTEIALFNSETISDFTLVKHQQYQAKFERFADIAKPQLVLAKAASTPDSTRAQAINIVEQGVQELIKEFKVDSPSPLVTAIFTTLELTLEITQGGQ